MKEKDTDMTELEKYLLQRRDELDHVEKPGIAEIWEGISRQLPATGTSYGKASGWQLSIGLYWQWGIAAAVALAVGIFFLLENRPSRSEKAFQLAEYYPELADEEQNYRQLIRQKEEEIGIEALDPQEFRDIFQELEILESIHQESIRDIPQFRDNEQLIQTLIRYYENKIRILERLSMEIQKRQYDENRNKETGI